ncbi:hypothetical protein B0O99DRAFT_596814 [Bisporella sp. PMI_857]|nr:hypothetical protein B0O99DRAFT_596814 [Bisporella sp. PMI_857]
MASERQATADPQPAPTQAQTQSQQRLNLCKCGSSWETRKMKICQNCLKPIEKPSPPDKRYILSVEKLEDVQKWLEETPYAEQPSECKPWLSDRRTNLAYEQVENASDNADSEGKSRRHRWKEMIGIGKV